MSTKYYIDIFKNDNAKLPHSPTINAEYLRKLDAGLIEREEYPKCWTFDLLDYYGMNRSASQQEEAETLEEELKAIPGCDSCKSTNEETTTVLTYENMNALVAFCNRWKSKFVDDCCASGHEIKNIMKNFIGKRFVIRFD